MNSSISVTLEELLERGINAIINPCTLFKDLSEVEMFLEIECTKQDLINTLKRFEDCGWYEACILIKNKINSYES